MAKDVPANYPVESIEGDVRDEPFRTHQLVMKARKVDFPRGRAGEFREGFYRVRGGTGGLLHSVRDGGLLRASGDGVTCVERVKLQILP